MKNDNEARAVRAKNYVNELSSQPKQKMQLSFRCVDLPTHGEKLDSFNEMIDRSRDISFATFAKHVDWKPVAKQMGYATEPGEQGLRLDKDYAVRFCKSKLDDEGVYFMVHSAIEFVFKPTGPVKKIRAGAAWR